MIAHGAGGDQGSPPGRNPEGAPQNREGSGRGRGREASGRRNVWRSIVTKKAPGKNFKGCLQLEGEKKLGKWKNGCVSHVTPGRKKESFTKKANLPMWRLLGRGYALPRKLHASKGFKTILMKKKKEHSKRKRTDCWTEKVLNSKKSRKRGEGEGK